MRRDEAWGAEGPTREGRRSATKLSTTEKGAGLLEIEENKKRNIYIRPYEERRRVGLERVGS